jgi:putative ABC transport system ATP-binding protein
LAIGGPRPGRAGDTPGNLDSATGQTILALLEELNAQDATIVVVTHERDLASRLPRRVEMLDGRIVADTAQPASPVSPTSRSNPAADNERSASRPSRWREG